MKNIKAATRLTCFSFSPFNPETSPSSSLILILRPATLPSVYPLAGLLYRGLTSISSPLGQDLTLPHRHLRLTPHPLDYAPHRSASLLSLKKQSRILPVQSLSM